LYTSICSICGVYLWAYLVGDGGCGGMQRCCRNIRFASAIFCVLPNKPQVPVHWLLEPAECPVKRYHAGFHCRIWNRHRAGVASCYRSDFAILVNGLPIVVSMRTSLIVYKCPNVLSLHRGFPSIPRPYARGSGCWSES
jgi:hypothetical protein